MKTIIIAAIIVIAGASIAKIVMQQPFILPSGKLAFFQFSGKHH